MRTSAEINHDIYNTGPALFEAVRKAVIEHGTVSSSPSGQRINQAKLDAAVRRVIAEAAPASLDHRGLWQMLWPRVVYAGTRASKASAEIASMRALVPLFQDLDEYSPDRYVFDRAQWDDFVAYWKGRFKDNSSQSRWLDLAKKDVDWNPGAYFASGRTTPAVWQLLVKDDQAFPLLRFSANAAKLEKYLKIAHFLYEHRSTGKQDAMAYYLDGIHLSDKHLTGQAWLEERRGLTLMRKRLAEQLGGDITALHAMMDLGLKTIKPDRVMTYLFSQLGWLQTLPARLSKQEVISLYLGESVVEEMTVRADVLAASLDAVGHLQAHRLLDIWFVKYGQEPEPDFGITANLQASGEGIQALLSNVRSLSADRIKPSDASVRWPCPEFLFVDANRPSLTNGGVSKRNPPKLHRSPLDEAEVHSLFMTQWKRGRENQPDLYPARLDNKPKDEILQKIRRHILPADAFLSVLAARS